MIHFWIFPEQDFAEWCELVATPQVDTYQDYLTLIAAVQADQERRGLINRLEQREGAIFEGNEACRQK